MLENLQEWQSLSMTGVAGRRYALYLAGVGVAMALWYRRLEPVRWVIAAVFLAFSFRHMRNIPFFLVMSLPLCAELLEEGYEQLSRRVPWSDRAVKKGSLVAAVLVAAMLWWLGTEHLHRIALSGLAPW
jgi:hypothetical protein